MPYDGGEHAQCCPLTRFKTGGYSLGRDSVAIHDEKKPA